MAETTGGGPPPNRSIAGDHRRAHDAVRRLRERMTGPPFMVYACAPCIETHRILLLDDHPADSVGNVRYRRGERETTSTS